MRQIRGPVLVVSDLVSVNLFNHQAITHQFVSNDVQANFIVGVNMKKIVKSELLIVVFAGSMFWDVQSVFAVDWVSNHNNDRVRIGCDIIQTVVKGFGSWDNPNRGRFDRFLGLTDNEIHPENYRHPEVEALAKLVNLGKVSYSVRAFSRTTAGSADEQAQQKEKIGLVMTIYTEGERSYSSIVNLGIDTFPGILDISPNLVLSDGSILRNAVIACHYSQ